MTTIDFSGRHSGIVRVTLSGSALRTASFAFATLPASPSVYIDHLLFSLFPRSSVTAPPSQATVSPFQGSLWVYRTAPSHKIKVAAISTEHASEDGYAGTEVHEYAYAWKYHDAQARAEPEERGNGWTR